MGSRARSDPTKQHWEDSEFPILCQTCLGDNPYIRMTKERFGKECKICNRPFTIFRWCPGKGARFKKTEVCQTCAKLKNVCQTCIFDLEYGLPVQVRDKALGIADNMPRSEVNREYFAQNMERQLAGSDPGELALEGGGKTKPNGVELLRMLARSTPYYKRNRAHICSFWVKGECKRGDECPYRHEMPTDPSDPLAQQNIKDRFYGSVDPVAERMMNRVARMPTLEVPKDTSVLTLYVGGLEADITEQDLRNHFYQFGEIANVSMAPRGSYAFVTFTSRRAAEQAAERSYNQLIIKGRKLKVQWGRSQSQQPQEAGQAGGVALVPVPGLPMPPMPPPPAGEPPHHPERDNVSNAQSNLPGRPFPPPGPMPFAGPAGFPMQPPPGFPPPPMAWPAPPPREEKHAQPTGREPRAVHYPSQAHG